MWCPACGRNLEASMAEDYEVPSPHEHHLEHAAEGQGDSLAQRIALMTAIIATIAALISYQSGSAQNEAMFLKNESILKQAEASDQWAFFQAKSVKAQLAADFAVVATGADDKARFLAVHEREDRERSEIQTEARKLQAESRELGEKSEARLRPHERLSVGLTFLQIAIALAAITVLTRRTWLLWGSVASAVIGLGASATAFFI
jgi:hypothetical protein